MNDAVRLGGGAGAAAMAGLFTQPLGTTRSLVERHGRFVRIGPPRAFGKQPALLHLARAGLAEIVLKNDTVFHNGGIIVRGRRGSTLNALRRHYFNAWGVEHEHYARLLGPHFRRSVVNEVAPIIASTVGEELDRWPTGETVDLTARLGSLLKRLASRTLYRDTDEALSLRAADMVERHARIASPTLARVFTGRLSGWIKTGLRTETDRTYQAILDWAATRTGLPAKRDIISAIVNSPDERGNPASPDRIAGYGWIMLGAAYDTAASILSWASVLLSLHPDVAGRLHDEISAASFDVALDVDALMDLPYLDAVIRETMRLVPPAPIQRRKATIDFDVDGCEVARGSQLLISAWMVNRDGDVYADPERFVPERWLGARYSPYEWLAFSAGPRRCIGIWFAMAFLKTTLANIVLRWRPEVPDGTSIAMRVAVTIRPVPGVPAILHRQDRAFRHSEISGEFRRHLRQCP